MTFANCKERAYLTIITSWPSSSTGISLYRDFSIVDTMSSNTSRVQRGLSPKIERVFFSAARFISVKVCGYLLGIGFDVDANHCLRCATTARP